MLKIGCSGYPVSMERYQETFKVVELNSTFYNYPKPQIVKKWREKAPKDFEFTVKTHQEITHKFKMSFEQPLDALDRMKEICRFLKAKVLLFQTPASVKPNKLNEIERFFEKVDRENLVFVWEPRGHAWETDKVREELAVTLEKLDISHVTDPFVSMPVYIGPIAYLRLHGHGEKMYYYQYLNSELEELFKKTNSLLGNQRDVYVFFNNLTMFEDAQRFSFYVNNRYFPNPEVTGKEALKAVLRKTIYPTTKNALIAKIGWKIIEVDGKQVRLKELLNSLAHNNYTTPEAVAKEIVI